MVLLSPHEGIEGHVFVVTGGLSSLGAALCLELVQRGADQVRCFDPRPSSPFLASLERNGVQIIPGGYTKDQIEKAFIGANCVFHLASHGISGKEMLQAGKIDEVNLTGTLNVVDGCLNSGVKRLVFKSSYNVIFGGKPIKNGNETMDYFPIEHQLDSYGRCKALAEQLVLKSNGRPLKVKNGGKLYTCAIRPAAVYGPGEEYHVPRLLNLAQSGVFRYLIGEADTKTDWVYVDNLVQALLLASMGLIDDIPGRKGAPAAGQAYFISDGSPVNSFCFIQPVVEGLGFTVPQRRLSIQSTMRIAWIFWGVYGLMYPWLDKEWVPQPPILPAEVYKMGVTHWFSITKAREELGYVPFVEPKEGIQRTLKCLKAEQLKAMLWVPVYVWIVIIVGMSLTFFAGFVPPHSTGIFEVVQRLLLTICRSQQIAQVIFVIACIAHISEGVYAWFLAKKVDPENAKAWSWQTFMLGFPSLLLLQRRVRERSKLIT